MAASARRLTKPKSVRDDPYRSKKWNELVRGRSFRPSDVPALTLLVQWYQVVDKCMEDLSSAGNGIQVAYSNKMDDIKAMPQIATMKQASAEIRALNKQLGINDGRDSDVKGEGGGGSDNEKTVLELLQGRRKDRREQATA